MNLDNMKSTHFLIHPALVSALLVDLTSQQDFMLVENLRNNLIAKAISGTAYYK